MQMPRHAGSGESSFSRHANSAEEGSRLSWAQVLPIVTRTTQYNSPSKLEAVQRSTACVLLCDREGRANMHVEWLVCNLLCSNTSRHPGPAAARVHSKLNILQAYAPRSYLAARVILDRTQHITMYPQRLSDVVPLHRPNILSRQV